MDLTADRGYIPLAMETYTAVPALLHDVGNHPKLLKDMNLLGGVVAGYDRLNLVSRDSECFASPALELIESPRDPVVHPGRLRFDSVTTLDIPITISIGEAIIRFSSKKKVTVSKPVILQFAAHDNPRHLLSMIQIFRHEEQDTDANNEDEAADDEALLLIDSVIISDIVRSTHLEFEVDNDSRSAQISADYYERISLLLGFTVASVRLIDDPSAYAKFFVEKLKHDVRLIFKSHLKDARTLIVATLEGIPTKKQEPWILARPDTKPLVEVYFYAANRLLYSRFELSVEADFSVSGEPVEMIEVSWSRQDSGSLMKICED
ncbi:MAG: hypothetical protein OXJ90_15370 [Spirochaetaceae bacterium]|nr:hypothetical protein [Spirochaetaceae bacterium]